MHILLVDDKKELFEILKDNFALVGHLLFWAADTQQTFDILKTEKINVILLDIMLGKENGVDTLKEIKDKYANIPIIMITGYATVETAVRTMKLGAFDYVKKPLDFDTLCNRVDAAYQATKLKDENDFLKKRLQEDSIQWDSKNPSYQLTKKMAIKLAPTDIPLLIQGENGSGKELLADFIYNHSKRIAKKFVKINCAAFPESLLDNELFGHERGAYTGADSEYQGVFEQANGGTLLLDEIGDMPLTIQAKILRVLQNQEIRRIGGKKTQKIDVRFIAATNKNLKKMINKGTFREDLYYRINGATLQIPSLRERKEDIIDIANCVLERLSTDYGTTKKTFSKEVGEKFLAYTWPGNIRELKNVVNFAYTISSSNEISREDLPPAFNYGTEQYESKLKPLQQKEKDLILKTLTAYHGNKSDAAKHLGMSRNTLYLKIEKYGITS
jgi:DNA-binding NtrC family response regulator